MACLSNEVRQYRHQMLFGLMDLENLDAFAFATTEFFQFATNFQTDVSPWVRRCLEPLLEPLFHQDSYGYRPGRSAVDAVRVARQRCWRYDWVVDIDIKGFFDNIDHELLLRAVRKHTNARGSYSISSVG